MATGRLGDTALGDTLAALAAYNTNGILVQSATSVFVGRTIVGTANKVDVSNGSGVAGNPTLTIPDAVTLVTPTVTGLETHGEGANIALGTVTGTMIGTLATQKLGFYNTTPVVQPVAATDLGVVLSALGLRVAGTAYPITTSGAVGLSGTITITDVNIVLGTTTGTKIGTLATQKLGFYGATPIVQPGAYTQTFATADKTLAAQTAAALTNNTGGVVSTTLAAITAGAAYAQADMTAVKNALASLADQVNKLRTDHVDTASALNSVIDDLQALGLAG